MAHRKAWFILFIAVLTAGLIGCGGALPPAEENAQLDSISLTPANPSIAKNTTVKFVATGIYASKTSKDLTYTVSWNSSDNAVATVDGQGRVTGRGAGKASIKASSGSIAGQTEVTVTSASLVSISITPVNPSIAKGTTQQFTATGTFSDDTTQDVTAQATWSSSDTGVATVSNADGSQGLAAPAAVGSTTITATSGGISGSSTLTVTPATLVTLAVTPAAPSIAKGTNQQFTATGTFSDSSTQDLTAQATWSSSNTGVATISNAAGSNGLAKSVAAGTATITATAGSVSQTATLTVTPATLSSLEVSPAAPSIAKGTNQQFTATGTYSDGSTQNLTASVTWSSSNTGVATISNAAGSNGLAKSVAAGTTTITAASGSVSQSATLTVTPATLSALAVSPASASITSGATKQFAATGTYSDGTTQNLTASVTWSSSNTGAAAISNAVGSKGLATGVAAGTTTITAASGNVSGTATLTVTAPSQATLTWSAPTTYTDGTFLDALTALAKYRVYYGSVSKMYTQSVDVVNSGTTMTYTVNLAPGTYYFTVTAIDTLGQESSYAAEVSKTL